jgi:hypothetical protein
VCRTSSVKRHFETKHEKTFKDQADKVESIKRAVSRYEKQASSFKVFTTAKDHGTEASYRIALQSMGSRLQMANLLRRLSSVVQMLFLKACQIKKRSSHE